MTLLLHQGTMQDTYYEALSLLELFRDLEEHLWYEHFTQVIGEFDELFDGMWEPQFEDLMDVRKFIRNLNSYSDLSELDLLILRLANRVSFLMSPHTRKVASYG